VRSYWLILVLIISGLQITSAAYATANGSIVQVSRRLRMSNYEALSPKDFYVDIGSSEGVRPGDTFNVYRMMAVVNMATGYSPNLIRIPLGELKVFLVGEFTSVGRLTARTPAGDIPSLDYPEFMLGDVVEPKSSLPFRQ
jgi:hypothetical protein